MIKNALAALGLFIFLSLADLAIAQENPLNELDRRQSVLETAVPIMEPSSDASLAKIPQTSTSGFGYYSSKNGAKIHSFSIQDSTDTYWYLKEDQQVIRPDTPVLKSTGKRPEESGLSKNTGLR